MAKKSFQKHKKISPKKAIISNSSFSITEDNDSKLVCDALLECIRAGDIDSFRGVLASYITSCNKLRFCKKTGLNRQTLYDILDPEKGFNPAFATVTAIMRGLTQ